MDLPPLTRKYFSLQPAKERTYRLLCTLLVIILSLILYFFWAPLRSTEIAYTFVSPTITNPYIYIISRAITTLGSEGFFLVLLSVIYWSVNKPLGSWGLIMMPLSIFITSEIPKDIVRLPRPAVRGVTVPTYTFPSGHTSGAVAVWGYLAILIKKRSFWILSLTIIILVGLSRVMLGYHFPGDVLGGYITGIIFLALFFWLGITLKEKNWHKKTSLSLLFLLSLTIPLALSFIPATYAPNLTGYTAGAALGYLLERETLQFTLQTTRLKHLIKALLGLPVIPLIILAPPALFTINSHLFTFTQYALSTFWITYLAPLLFIKLNLAQKTTH
ncbi:phosphatase PAP2 family protein [Dethiobacter alkaliphilus]|uniref:Phosphoesterase PA-phosphatase related protein n=1 Tax=Dethiobacter alkaliphilus AHT 1 TaxID=555088 RepID=C0GGL1_DETAL|nr:phosphatase PAP2 family protein [Dethiobacter alkaliphilus]EEG77452.1 phosphoesterase PA-phosphatase related protein [Dethiobacter alkaliphilus AHT 1]